MLHAGMGESRLDRRQGKEGWRVSSWTYGEHDDDKVLLLDVNFGDSLDIIENLACGMTTSDATSQPSQPPMAKGEMVQGHASSASRGSSSTFPLTHGRHWGQHTPIDGPRSLDSGCGPSGCEHTPA